MAEPVAHGHLMLWAAVVLAVHLTLQTELLEHPVLMDVVLEAVGVEAQEMAEQVVRLEQEAAEEVQTPLMLMLATAA